MRDDLPDHAMPFLLMAGFRGLVDQLHARLAARGYEGLRATHGFAMQAIGEGCTSVELGQRLGVSKQAAGKTARSLEEMGLIGRVGSPHDAREKLLTPTPRGRQMLTESGSIIEDLVGAWRDQLGDQAVDTTLSTLARVDHGRRTTTDLSDWF